MPWDERLDRRDDPRDRILTAFARTVARHGYERAHIDHVVRIAGLSKRTVYDEFDGKAGLFGVFQERTLTTLESRLLAAFDPGAADLHREIDHAMQTYCTLLAEAPATSWAMIVEAANAGGEVATLYWRSIERSAAFLQAACAAAAAQHPGLVRPMSLTTAIAIIGGLHELVRAAAGPEHLPGLLPDLREAGTELIASLALSPAAH